MLKRTIFDENRYIYYLKYINYLGNMKTEMH